MKISNDIQGEIKNAVLSVDENAEVILFGSRARGDYKEDSDWDVLVLTKKDEDDFSSKRLIRDALYVLELSSGEIITSIIRSKIFWNRLRSTPLYWEVQKDRKPL